MVECWICGKQYAPNPEKVKAWAESEEPFDGTDWECGECIDNSGSPEPDDWAAEEAEAKVQRIRQFIDGG